VSAICGILQLDHAPVDPDLLNRMAHTSAYRGPDGIHTWVQGEVGLAHLALHSTPEAVSETQPLPNRRADQVLVADARVDNRPELIHILTAKGLLPDTHPTDADLILAAYECWGEACPDQIIGDFAFAIWDQDQCKLFCARDACGIKPFHYSLDRAAFRFATDVEQVLADERIRRDLDGYAIADFLTYNWRDQARTMFAAVHSLPPGHCLRLDAAGPRAWRYWNPDRVAPIHYATDDEYVQHFRELFSRCVADRLRSRTGAAALMVSGGLDSSSIAAVAQNLYTQACTTARPIAFTHVAEDEPETDERQYSQLLNSELGLELHAHLFNSEPLPESLEAYTPILNLPFLLETAPPAFMQPLKQNHCDVFIRGDGGDILFDAAKTQYIDAMRSGHWRQAWPWMRAGRQQGNTWPQILRSFFIWPFLPQRLRYWGARLRGSWRFGHVPRWLHPQFSRQASPAERLYRQGYPRRFRSPTRQAQYETYIGLGLQPISTVLFNILANQNGLEARFPFLDRRLMEFMLAAPLRLGAQPGPANTKWLLRQAMRGILPENIRLRTTKTFGDPERMRALYIQAQDRLTAQFANAKLTQYDIINNKILIFEFLAFCGNTGYYKSDIHFTLTLLMEQWLESSIWETVALRFDPLLPWQHE
jgi:asparagine synthase (glutamine-hydrolysing)